MVISFIVWCMYVIRRKQIKYWFYLIGIICFISVISIISINFSNFIIYFTKRYAVEVFRNRVGGAIALYKMPKERSWEIDDMFDLEVAEFLLNGRK